MTHGPNLLAHEQLALEELRIEIHKIVGSIKDLEVTFYVGNFQDPITVLKGDGTNKLIISFKQDGQVKYEWIAKSLTELTKEYVSIFVKRVASVAFTVLVNVSSQLVNQVIVSNGLKAIAWK